VDLFYEIPDYPEDVSGTSVLVRLLDGLGFRFRWSTEGLSDEDYKFRPAPDCMSIEELVRHIWGLVNWACISTMNKSYERAEDVYLVRKDILEMIFALRGALQSMDDEDLEALRIDKRPFWHIINGPIADALTHVGQINSFRRLAGNPTPKANVFVGLPPKE
jgi:hypothetical protein